MVLFGSIDIPLWILATLAVPVLLVLALYIYGVYKHTYFSRRGIPSPKTSLYYGHLKDVMSEGMAKFDRRAEEELGPIWGFYWGNHPAIVVCDPEMIKEITIRQFSKFYNRAEVIELPKYWKTSVNNARGPMWRYLRAVLQPTFSSSKVKGMRPLIKHCLDEFISVVSEELDQSEDQVVNMYEYYKHLTMDVICGTSFGIDVDSQRNKDGPFAKHVAAIFGTGLNSTVLLLNFFFPDIRKYIMMFVKDYLPIKSMDFMKATVKKAIEARRNDSAHHTDLLQLMMATMTDSPNKGVSEFKSFEEMKVSGMNENDIVYNGIIFLAAGHETTASLLAWMTYFLATNPDYQQRLVEEIDDVTKGQESNITYDAILKMEYLEMFLQETLRLYPPATRFNREPICDVTIKGITFEKGCDVTIALSCLHRNPKYWTDPDTFNPERFSRENIDKIVPFSFIPFGAGPRNCIGMKLALVETKMAIVKFLQTFTVEASSKLSSDVNTSGGLSKPKNGTWVKLVRRCDE